MVPQAKFGYTLSLYRTPTHRQKSECHEIDAQSVYSCAVFTISKQISSDIPRQCSAHLEKISDPRD